MSGTQAPPNTPGLSAAGGPSSKDSHGASHNFNQFSIYSNEEHTNQLEQHIDKTIFHWLQNNNVAENFAQQKIQTI